MNRYLFSFVFIASVVVQSSVDAQSNRQRGTAVGGIAGAVVGGIIGENNDEAGAGAVIGGLLGAVAGNVIGDAADQQQALDYQRRVYLQQQRQQHQIAVMKQSVSLQDVISMTRSGLGETVIINQIQQRGVQSKLGVPEIISLHQQGVSERVITAMQSARVGNQPETPQPIQARPIIRQEVVTPAPVIVEERYFLPSYPPPRYHYHTPHYRSRSGFHIRF